MHYKHYTSQAVRLQARSLHVVLPMCLSPSSGRQIILMLIQSLAVQLKLLIFIFFFYYFFPYQKANS